MMGKMDDDEFNTLKFKLPFLFKTDKNQFYNCVETLKKNIANMSTFQIIDLFYTYHALKISKIWVQFLDSVFDLLPLSHQIDIIKFCCSCSDDHVDNMKILIDKIFSTILENDELILELCFLDWKFFKPLLSSKLGSVSRINQKLSLYIYEKALMTIHNEDAKLKILEKVMHFREFNTEEISFILTLLEIPEFTGRILDVCFRSDNFSLLTKAYEVLRREKSENLYDDKNAVHFFEIKKETLEEIKSVDVEDLLFHLEEFLDISRLYLDDLKIIYHIANLVMTTNCRINSVSVEKIFKYLWLKCNFEDKKNLIIEMNDYDSSICCYGIIINIFAYVSAIKNEEYLTVSKLHKAIESLKTSYPPDDDIWTDPDVIEQLLKTID